MNIIVTGGRDYTNKDFVFKVLGSLDPTKIYVGDCPTGVDAFVHKYCQMNWSKSGVAIQIFEADWINLGKSAGPIRNEQMCFTASSEPYTSWTLIAFPGGKGTENCIKNAKKFGIPVLRVDDK